ncbi:HsdM family class I SAM-dependent methyltransferase [Bacillus kwashiorkori]|uniref:HsdM family class I SAM-dependent methyltransferase n=1 Tax=Bacillus kwashiorkori TaxID=1522318 RepID=UPI000782D7F9|nr:N-6 DNA methylase [Bacillus kwashiorkori]
MPTMKKQLESEYITSVSSEHRKKYGQFFTPKHISDLMAKWVTKDLAKGATILDPAVGLGVFIRSMKEQLTAGQQRNVTFFGYEIDRKILDYFAAHLDDTNITIFHEDYLTSNWKNTYDAIICNPPYLKFHDYEDKDTLLKIVSEEMNLELSGFTNIYTLFLLKALHQLNHGGRAAFIIPSEFLNSDYGKQIKQYLLDSKLLKFVVILDFTTNWFEDATTTSALFFFEKKNPKDFIEFINIDSKEKLERTESYISKYPEQPRLGNTVALTDIDINKKWRIYYQGENSSKYKNLKAFSNFAKASRGIATGANEFFKFNKTKQAQYQIANQFLIPCLTKAVQVDKNFFTTDDFNNLWENDKHVKLLNAYTKDLHDENLKNYIKYGEKLGYHERYLTKNRNPWFKNETREPAPILVGVFNREKIKFIRNEANVVNLTTFHCIYMLPMYDEYTNVLMAYLLTDVAQEILEDSRREYGRGLKKFEPNDINTSLVIDLDSLTTEQIQFITDIYQVLREKQLNGAEITMELHTLNKFFKSLLVI